MTDHLEGYLLSPTDDFLEYLLEEIGMSLPEVQARGPRYMAPPRAFRPVLRGFSSSQGYL